MLLKNVKYTDMLREDQNLVALFKKLLGVKF